MIIIILYIQLDMKSTAPLVSIGCNYILCVSYSEIQRQVELTLKRCTVGSKLITPLVLNYLAKHLLLTFFVCLKWKHIEREVYNRDDDGHWFDNTCWLIRLRKT